jgi:hypothetical protein
MAIETALGIVKAAVNVVKLLCPAFLTGLIDPGLRVDYERSGIKETIKIWALHDVITKIIVEPSADARLAIDPPEIPSLLPGQTVTCTLLVEEGSPDIVSVTTLVGFLRSRRGAKLKVCFRFTDSKGRRRRIPFIAEKIGARHLVHWTPGRVERASPDW